MNSDKTILNVGLPKGSLNQKGRGETWKLLSEAQYDIQGYEPGNEDARSLAIANDLELGLYLIRPQSIGLEMNDYRLIDVAIMGRDWAEEWKLTGRELELLANLGYGNARVVLATDGKIASCFDRAPTLEDIFQTCNPVRGFTELPRITERYLMQSQEYVSRFGRKKPSVYFRAGMIQRVRKPLDEVQLIVSEGLTESNLLKNVASFVVDVTQTGRTLEENGAVILDTILETEAGLYASPRINKLPSARRKAEEFRDMLVSAVDARRRQFYTMNLPAENLPAFAEWAIGEGYCAKTPSVMMYGENASVNVLVKKSQIPAFLAGLKKYNATDVVSLDTSQVFALSKGDGK